MINLLLTQQVLAKSINWRIKKMSKELSIRVFELFVDFLKLRRKTLDRIYATTLHKTPTEVINILENSENNEFFNLKERAKIMTPHASLNFLLSAVWWKEQGIDFDLSCRIVP